MGSPHTQLAQPSFPKLQLMSGASPTFHVSLEGLNRQRAKNRHTTQLCTLPLEDNPAHYPHINLKRNSH